jgi:hypothetical protein
MRLRALPSSPSGKGFGTWTPPERKPLPTPAANAAQRSGAASQKRCTRRDYKGYKGTRVRVGRQPGTSGHGLTIGPVRSYSAEGGGNTR